MKEKASADVHGSMDAEATSLWAVDKEVKRSLFYKEKEKRWEEIMGKCPKTSLLPLIFLYPGLVPGSTPVAPIMLPAPLIHGLSHSWLQVSLLFLMFSSASLSWTSSLESQPDQTESQKNIFVGVVALALH